MDLLQSMKLFFPLLGYFQVFSLASNGDKQAFNKSLLDYFFRVASWSGITVAKDVSMMEFCILLLNCF